MSNIDIKIVGAANLGQVQGAFDKLTAHIAATNAQLAKMVASQAAVNPKGYERLTTAATNMDKTWRNAVDSTGMFERNQLRINSATNEYIKKLQAQKLSFREMYRERKTASLAFQEQLRMETSLMVRQGVQASRNGKVMVETTHLKGLANDAELAAHRMAFLSEQLKSGSHQMVNWGKNTQWAGRQLMVGFTIPLAAFGAAAGMAAYTVDKELTRIAKVYDTTADSTSGALNDIRAVELELQKVRQDSMRVAIEAAEAYGVAAKDTLNVTAELAATGLSGQKLQESTTEVMRIAALGELDYQTAVEATVSMQQVFRMSTVELAEAFDYMNNVENSTSLATADFAAAIPIAAAPIQAFGGDIKELGTLLTAMKSRGIEATEGANAIKAAMQRLGRPSKQIQEEWTALTGTDIKSIFENAESLQDMFIKIGDATDQLSDKDKIKAFAGLFGTYQVTRMKAMVDGLGDIEKGYGQTADAARIAGVSAEENARIAAAEIEKQAQSISGRWDRAWNTFMAKLSTFGEPFVVVGTVVMNTLNALMDLFNAMPGWVKVLAAVTAGAAALSGVLIMLAGLTANLFGSTVVRGMAALTGWWAKLNGAMGIATLEQRAATKAAELHKATTMGQITTIEAQTAAIHGLIAAQRAAYKEQFGKELVMPGYYESPEAARAARTAAASDRMEKTSARFARNMKVAAVSGVALAGLWAAMNMDAEGVMGHMAKIVFYASVFGPMITPVASMMVSSFKKSNTHAKALNKTMKSNLAVAEATAAANAAGAAGSAAGAAGSSGGLLARSLGFMKSPAGIAVGLGVLAIGGGIALWKNHLEDAKEEQKKILDEMKESATEQAALTNSAETFATATGKSYNNMVLYHKTANAERRAAEATKYQEALDRYSAEGENEDAAKGFADLSFTDKQNRAVIMYIDLITRAGASTKEAKREIQALYDVTGESADEAKRLADNIALMAGDNTGQQLERALKNSAKALDEINLPSVAKEFDAQKKEIEAKATEMAGWWADAFSNADPQGKETLVGDFADRMIDSYAGVQEEVKRQLEEGALGFDVLAGMEQQYLSEEDEKALKRMKEILAGTAEDFANAVDSGEFNEILARIEEHYRGVSQDVDPIVKPAKELNKYLLDELKTRGLIGDEVTNLKDLLLDISIIEFAPDGESLRDYVNRSMDDLNNFINNSQVAGGIFGGMFNADAREHIEAEQDRLFSYIEKENKRRGLPAAKTFEEAWNNFNLNNAQIALINVQKKAEDVAKGPYKINFAGNIDTFKDFYKNSMQSVQNEMADAYRDDFDNRMESALEARSDYWDRQMEAQSNAFERQSDALEAKWEKRKDNAEKYWEGRIENIQRAMDAEEKAEDRRQKMFDAEIARIQRLNEAMNRNIDFNVALNSGNLDEAAKIRNDVMASETESALERAAEAGSEASDRRVHRLEKRMERLEESRDKYMERLEKREDAEKKHLEKMQKMREKALSERAEADQEALRDSWEMEKENLEERLALFLAYIPRNIKELKKHMKDMGFEYDVFGKALSKKGDKWNKDIASRLKYHMKTQVSSLMSDEMWTKFGKGALAKVVKGMGFGNVGGFSKFMDTGKLPNNWGKNSSTSQNAGKSGVDPGPQNAHRHTGGIIDGSPGSRKGVARTQRGLSPSEVNLTAKKGEFVVNEHATKKNRGLLESINKGVDPHGKYGIGGKNTVTGLAGFPAAFAARGLASGIGSALTTAFEKKMQWVRAQSAVASMFGIGNAGTYGDRTFSTEQLKNAAIIASVGSRMGMSTRDLMIGIMTAITESGLINVNYGDRDSLGLFQQRPSMGWGTPAQVTDPEYAARKFFEGLKAITGRGSMTPWAAAQAVQRSAFADGSNYQIYWDEAQAIFRDGLTRQKNGQYRLGAGGFQRATVPGKGWSNTHDYRNSTATPLYAYNDGVVTASKATTSGGNPGNGIYTDPASGRPYTSYGETITIRGDDGSTVLYAHLSPGKRYVRAGQRVTGGQLIGVSGNTGNSTGFHTHFTTNGSENAKGFFESKGIPLKKGGTIKNDNTPAMLHKNERVLTAPLTSKLDSVVDALYRATKDGKTLHSEPLRDKAKKAKANWKYPNQTVGAADYPYTWFDYSTFKPKNKKRDAKGAESNYDLGTIGGTGAGTSVKMATLNSYWEVPAKKAIADVARLIPKVDFISMQEMDYKYRQVKAWLAKQGWGMLHGKTSTESGAVMAYNNKNWKLDKGYTKKIGDLTNKSIIGGGKKRYVNYGLFSNRESGRKIWNMAAHTVPLRHMGPKQKPLFQEQWNNLDELVRKLQGTGAPVFLGGDMNNMPSRRWWRTPGGLDTFHGGGVDWIFGDPKMAKLVNKGFMGGMHTDHKGAYIANFKIPALSKGASDIRFDNTLANLHKGEAVLTKDINDKFRQGVDNFATGGNNEYNVKVNLYGADVDADEVANTVITKLQRMEARKPRSRRG